MKKKFIRHTQKTWGYPELPTMRDEPGPGIPEAAIGLAIGLMWLLLLGAAFKLIFTIIG